MKYLKINLIRAGWISLLSIVAWSCIPTTYTFYPAQRRLSKKIDVNDSIYMIYPYAKFSIIGEKDEVMNIDNRRIRGLAILSRAHLIEFFEEKVKFTGLVLPLHLRDSLVSQFLSMNRFFYQHKKNSYSFSFNSNKRGYGLIYGIDWRVRDFEYLRSPRTNRSLIFSYWCLFDLKSGEVIDYQYKFTARIGGWDRQNRCTDERGFDFVTREALYKTARHFLKQLPKHRVS